MRFLGIGKRMAGHKKKGSRVKDMTQGKPVKLILGFAVPLLFGYLFQQFYNMADAWVVGEFCG